MPFVRMRAGVLFQPIMPSGQRPNCLVCVFFWFFGLLLRRIASVCCSHADTGWASGPQFRSRAGISVCMRVRVPFSTFGYFYWQF